MWWTILLKIVTLGIYEGKAAAEKKAAADKAESEALKRENDAGKGKP